MDSGNSSDEGVQTGPSFAAKATDTLLEPLRILVSRNALTAYLSTFLFFATAICMIFVSAFAYGVFYYNFIPRVGLERIVHLQFGDGHPWGIAALDSGLISSQAYDVHVELELPRTPSNLATGNFMLDLTLLSQSSTSARTGEITAPPISHSRRPAILTYASPLVDISSKASFMPLYVLGWKREAERLVIPMMERVEFSRGARNVPDILRLEVQSEEKMQFYSAKVKFRASFTGLRWIMYHWRIPSFFVFSFMFWSVSMLSFSLSWILLACLSNEGVKTEEEDEGVKEEEDRESEPTIKEEHSEKLGLLDIESTTETSDREGETDSDDGVNHLYDVGRKSRITTAESGPSEAAGSGTGTESAGPSGVQRRRSRLFKEEDS
ncbi:putative adipose-regulatory protein-domain-containing protein [Aspergillus similis]